VRAEIGIQMRMTSNKVGRQAAKSEKGIAVAKRKAADEMRRGNMDGARIHAESAIRLQSQSISYMRLQSQIDAVASKVKDAELARQVTADLSGVTQSLGMALGTIDTHEVSKVMATFEQQFEDIDVINLHINKSINASTSSTTPQGEVDSLLLQIAESNRLDTAHMLPGVGHNQVGQLGVGGPVTNAPDEIDVRLAAMNNNGPAGP
jgi:charged multivesicular body protein 1